MNTATASMVKAIHDRKELYDLTAQLKRRVYQSYPSIKIDDIAKIINGINQIEKDIDNRFIAATTIDG